MGQGKAATTVAIVSAKTPIVLIPVQRQNWIIAKASAEDIEQIRQWIDKLDIKESVKMEQETIRAHLIISGCLFIVVWNWKTV